MGLLYFFHTYFSGNFGVRGVGLKKVIFAAMEFVWISIIAFAVYCPFYDRSQWLGWFGVTNREIELSDYIAFFGCMVLMASYILFYFNQKTQNTAPGDFEH